MAYTIPKENFSGKVIEMSIGAGAKQLPVGGGSALPFHTFEGEPNKRPVIAMEIQDVPPADWPEEVAKPFAAVSSDPVKWARFCQNELGAQAIALLLVGTHPDRENRSVADADDGLGAHAVGVRHLAVENDRDDLHLLVRVRGEALSGLDDIVIEDGQGAELDVCRVIAPRRGDSVHASALWALADEGLEDKRLSAALALGVKSAVRDGGVPHSAVVRTINELYQLNAF